MFYSNKNNIKIQLQTCAHYPYIQFLKGTGLEINFFRIRWTTTAFNRLLVRWGSSNNKYFNLWFSFGMYITLILFPLVIILMIQALFQNIFSSSSRDSEPTLTVEPVVPGLNLPASELGYYGVALIVCSIFHELGHAIAAVREDVHLVNIGVNILFILPVAYVNLSTEKFNSLNPWRMLRITCAGVWHNVVLAVFAYMLYCILPYLFSVLFYVNNGVFVAEVYKNSPLLGQRGLSPGNTIVRINDCDIKNETSWEECLKQIGSSKPAFCADSDLIHNLDESVPLRHTGNGFYDCCSENKNGHLCFEYLESNDGIIEIPPHVCLPVRIVIEKSPKFCTNSAKNCFGNLHCIRPMLANNTNLFKIKVIGKRDVVYIGLATDLLYTVRVSQYIPKYVFQSSVVPDFISKVLKYFVVFSGGLAIVNVIPCIFMDGQHIANGLVHIFLGKTLGSVHNINFTSLIISLCGTLLIISHCTYSVYKMIAS